MLTTPPQRFFVLEIAMTVKNSFYFWFTREYLRFLMFSRILEIHVRSRILEFDHGNREFSIKRIPFISGLHENTWDFWCFWEFSRFLWAEEFLGLTSEIENSRDQEDSRLLWNREFWRRPSADTGENLPTPAGNWTPDLLNRERRRYQFSHRATNHLGHPNQG